MKVIVTGIGRCGTKTMFEFFKYQGWTAYHCRYGIKAAELAHKTWIDMSWGKTDTAKEFAQSVYNGLTKDDPANICESEDKYYCIIEELYKLDNDIKFIILNRDVEGFVKSGSFRKWYQTDSAYDKVRLDPGKKIPDPAHKIKWLRDEVNETIWRQLHNIPEESYISFELADFQNGSEMNMKLNGFLKKGLMAKYDWSVKHNKNQYIELDKKNEW